MEEIKVGEIARLRDGTITRIDKIKENTFECKFHKIRCELYVNFIVKHSFDIKDLVQAGDLIKIPEGIYEVIFDESYEKLGILVPNKKQLAVRHSSLEYIFSEYEKVEILTKEQFNQMKYVVGDESNE